ncbi:hypothetical protein DL98DRAFT_248721 [Cadophora sp. DSE1049]|nr:hypothetical protein DL98DRAFT_248721 [Cadophora sp. DSE1049]
MSTTQAPGLSWTFVAPDNTAEAFNPLQSFKDTSSYGNVHGSFCEHLMQGIRHFIHPISRAERAFCLNLLLAPITAMSASRKTSFAFAYYISIQLDKQEVRCRSQCTGEEKAPVDAMPSICTDMGFDQNALEVGQQLVDALGLPPLPLSYSRKAGTPPFVMASFLGVCSAAEESPLTEQLSSPWMLVACTVRPRPGHLFCDRPLFPFPLFFSSLSFFLSVLYTFLRTSLFPPPSCSCV